MYSIFAVLFNEYHKNCPNMIPAGNVSYPTDSVTTDKVIHVHIFVNHVWMQIV